MSRLHRLKQNHPLDVAIYHIEYVIETDGAHNLRAQSHNLVWYQYFMLDSILLIFTTVAGAIFLQRLVCQEKIQQFQLYRGSYIRSEKSPGIQPKHILNLKKVYTT